MATTLKQVAVDSGTHNYTSVVGDAAVALEVWGDSSANTIDVSNNTADGTTIHGLSGDDTIKFGVGSGKDIVVYNAGEGKDTINGFDPTKQTIKFGNVNASQLSFSLTGGGDVVVSLDANNSITLHGAAPFTDLSAFVKDFVTADNGKFVFGKDNAGNTIDAGSAAAAAGAYVVGLDGDDVIKYYGTEKFVDGGKATTANTVDDSSAVNAVTIDLSDTTKFKNVTNVKGGTAYADIVRGDAGNNTIDYSASTGNNLIWGKAGNDTLKGGKGDDTFYFGTGDGTDTVTLGGANSGKDTIKLYNVKASDVTFTSVGATLEVTFNGNTADKLVIADWSTAATQPTFVTSDNAAGFKVGVGAAITYDAKIQKYVGNSDGSTVLTTDGKGDTVTLYDTTKYSNIVKVTSAASTAGDILRGVGGFKSSVLDASLNTNGNQLCGGVGGTDTLKGGTGDDTFFFGSGDGVDAVTGNGGKDVVKLYNVNVADLVFADDAAAGLKVTFKNNSTDSLDIVDFNAKPSVTFVTKDNAGFTVVKGTNAAEKYDAKAGFYLDTAVGTLDASAVSTGITATLGDTTKYSGILNATGGSGNDILRGVAGKTSTLIGGGGSDQLWAGKGAVNSVLSGGTTGVDDGVADTYFFGAGDGTVKVDSYGKEDLVKLYSAKATDLVFANDGTDLTVSFKGDSSASKLTVAGYAASTVRPTFATTDNTGFDVVAAASTTSAVKYDAKALAYVAVTGATAGQGDVIDATAQTAGVTISLYDTAKYQGINNIKGGAGSDTLRGNSAANTIVAGDGGALIWGGAGTDTLTGGKGADVFYFGAGDGTDTITANGSDKTDKVMLYTNGLTASDVKLSAVGAADLTLTIGSDSLKITGWDATTSVNTFVLGTKQTTDNTYKVSNVQGTYQLVKA